MTDENQVLLEESLSFVIQQQCACDFDTSHFTDSEFKCTNGGKQIAFTTSIVYSSPSGAITASDIVEMMQSWAEKNGTSLAIGNETGSSAPVSQIVCISNITVLVFVTYRTTYGLYTSH